ncbi:MAG: hypothetical protein HC869_10350 [Rhodospirillales bacterium]|nr:hypothetical protein [Rhodospirillales bacterium]
MNEPFGGQVIGAEVPTGTGAPDILGSDLEQGTYVLSESATKVSGEALKRARREFEKLKPAAWKEEARRNPQKYTAEQLGRMVKGQAPIGDDGYSMEVHHKKQLQHGGSNTFDNFDFKSREKHRLGENYRQNHPLKDGEGP